jgi:glycosyltransferase involved in cell wall biosynthesis
MDKLLISVIICTYNRAALLANCLESLLKQQPPPDAGEIIVVDNNSTDNTKELVSQYKSKIPHLKYVFEKNQGLSYARNRGCAEAGAIYLCYLDDDAAAPPEYLSNIARIINEYSPDILGGPVYPYYTTNKPRWFKDEYETRKYADKSGFSASAAVSGGNYIIKKNLLEKLGMFDVKLGMIGGKMGLGEERKVLEQYRSVTPAAAQKVYYALDCYINHHVPREKMTLRYLIKRSYTAGKMSQQVITPYHSSGINDVNAGVKKKRSFFKRLTAFITVNFKNLKTNTGFDMVKILQFFARYAGIYIGANLEKFSRKRNPS